MFCGKIKRYITWALLPISLSLLGCTDAAPRAELPPTIAPTVQAAQPINTSQTLPLTILAKINQNQFRIALAATPRQQQIGLMFRTELADDEGMLFPFNPPRRVAFWMKNTLIPLDMLYIRNGVIREIKANVPPCKTPSCPSYPSTVLIDQVIEIRGGRAAELNIQVGDRVDLQKLNSSSETEK